MKTIPILLMVLFIIGCDPNEYYDQYYQNRKEADICLSSNCTTVQCTWLADGLTQIPVYVIVQDDISDDKNSILLKCEKGYFLKSGKSESMIKAEKTKADLTSMTCFSAVKQEYRESNEFLAVDTLIAGLDTGTFTLSLRLDDYSDSYKISFKSAPIEDVHIASDKFAVYNTSMSEATITVKATRKTGKPSIGQKIDFRIELGDGTIIDQASNFRNTSNHINSHSEASTTFTIGETNYTGTVKCIACIQKVGPGSKCDTLVMNVLQK